MKLTYHTFFCQLKPLVLRKSESYKNVEKKDKPMKMSKLTITLKCVWKCWK